MKSKFISGLEKDHVTAENSDIIKAWFQLVEEEIKKDSVEKENIYNIDKKDIIIGVLEKVQVIISKYEKRQYITATGNCEWVSLVECISAIGKALSP